MKALFFCSLGTVIPLLRVRFSGGCYTLYISLLCKYNWVFCLLDNLHLRKCIQRNGWPEFWSQCMASRCLVGHMCIPCVKTSPTKIFVLQICFQLLHVIITHNIHGVSIWSLTKSCKHVMISLKIQSNEHRLSHLLYQPLWIVANQTSLFPKIPKDRKREMYQVRQGVASSWGFENVCWHGNHLLALSQAQMFLLTSSSR
jgi:hypothetical protein